MNDIETAQLTSQLASQPSQLPSQPEQRTTSARKPLILYILVPIEVIVCLFTFLVSLIIIFGSDPPSKVFGLYGYGLGYHLTGDSMNPTMNESGLTVLCTTPFEDLQIGDVILFKRRYEELSETFVYGLRSEKRYMNESGEAVKEYDSEHPIEVIDNIPSGKVSEEAGFQDVLDPDSVFYDDGLEYTPGEYIMHRVVSINTNGDKALATKGDNNKALEEFPVMESGYLAKVVWYRDGLGEVCRNLISLFPYLCGASAGLWLLVRVIKLIYRHKNTVTDV